MKPLDKNKKYDLSQLDDEQLQTVYKATFTPRHIKCYYLYFDEDKWFFTTNNKGNLTNALELFDNDDNSVYDDILSLIEKGKQHGLKIVVTFEKI